MPGADAEIPVQGPGGLMPDPDHPRPAALADSRPKTGCRGYPLACQPSRYPLGQAGNDPP